MSSIFTNPGQGGGGGSSFLPSDYVQAKSESRSNLLAVFSFTLVMFGVVAAFMVTNRRWESIREKQVQIQTAYEQEAQKIEQLKMLEMTRSNMIDKARVTTALIERVPRSVLLGEFVLRMPTNLRFDEIKLESKRVKGIATPPSGQVKSLKAQGPKAAAKPRIEAPRYNHTISIVGIARRNNDIADYLARLNDCGLLQRVELEFIRDTIINDEKLRRFRIVCKLRSDADPSQLDSIQRVIALAHPVDDAVEKQFGSGFLGRAVEMFIKSDSSDESIAADGSDSEDQGELATVDTEPEGEGG